MPVSPVSPQSSTSNVHSSGLIPGFVPAGIADSTSSIASLRYRRPEVDNRSCIRKGSDCLFYIPRKIYQLINAILKTAWSFLTYFFCISFSPKDPRLLAAERDKKKIRSWTKEEFIEKAKEFNILDEIGKVAYRDLNWTEHTWEKLMSQLVSYTRLGVEAVEDHRYLAEVVMKDHLDCTISFYQHPNN